ncbi:MAG: tyrosine-type recombinase/integrase [Candidatus Nanoarchaeia archaeon]
MSQKADNTRNKALVSTLFWSGARVSELLNMRIGEIEITQSGARILLRGKTGERNILIVAGVDYLTRWLEEHPRKDNPESFVWCPLQHRQNKARDRPITPRQVRDILRDVAKKSGMNKPTNPHHFRHSIATVLSNRLTEAQMCNYFGWRLGSKMPAIYVHTSGRDMDSAILSAFGLKPKEDIGESIKPKTCFRCDYPHNSNTADYCSRCGTPLSIDKIVKHTDKEQALIEALEDPQIYGRLVERLAEIVSRKISQKNER